MSDSFVSWLDTFVEEKGIDVDQILEVDGPSGRNLIPLVHVIRAMKRAPEGEQGAIKDTLVKIDFKNGDSVDFFRHLAGALAR